MHKCKIKYIYVNYINPHIDMHTHIDTHIHTHSDSRVCVCVSVLVCVCLCVHVHVCFCVCMIDRLRRDVAAIHLYFRNGSFVNVITTQLLDNLYSVILITLLSYYSDTVIDISQYPMGSVDVTGFDDGAGVRCSCGDVIFFLHFTLYSHGLYAIFYTALFSFFRADILCNDFSLLLLVLVSYCNHSCCSRSCYCKSLWR